MAANYSVRVEARFEAAHYLREYRGISEPLHGHSYKVEADLAARDRLSRSTARPHGRRAPVIRMGACAAVSI
jgi:hypothetical protein